MAEVSQKGPVHTEYGWYKSSYSLSNGACVEVRPGDLVEVRNSRAPGAGKLSFTHAEWRAFVAGVKAGEFDFGIC
jgi:hypothetical protein